MKHLAIVWACALALAGAAPAFGQPPGVSLRSVGLEIGSMTPEDASTTASLGARIGLGTIARSWLHLSSGVTYWSAERDDVDGEVQDLSLRASVGIELMDASGVQPYLVTGPALHWIGADLPDRPLLEDAVDGLNVGWDVGGGLKSTRGSLELRAELRGQFVNNVTGWGLLVGVGWARRATSY